MWAFQGIEHKKTVDGNTTFDAETAMIDDTYMVGKISVKNHPFVEHFKFVKALEDENTVAKLTQHFSVRVHMTVWLICCLEKKMSMPIILNLMMRDPEDLSRLQKHLVTKK